MISAMRLYHRRSLEIVGVLGKIGSWEELGVANPPDFKPTFVTAAKVCAQFVEWAEGKAATVNWSDEKDILKTAIMLRTVGAITGQCQRQSTYFVSLYSFLPYERNDN